ncbi:hypothetical protein, partial [Actinomycetospora succinea]
MPVGRRRAGLSASLVVEVVAVAGPAGAFVVAVAGGPAGGRPGGGVAGRPGAPAGAAPRGPG